MIAFVSDPQGKIESALPNGRPERVPSEDTMPVYEFRCADCQRRFNALIGMTAEPDDERCPHCGGHNATRLVSRFMHGRTEDDRLDELADRMETMGEPDSEREMRAMVKEMGKAMDEDLSDEMEEMFDADDGGESGDDLGADGALD